MEQIFSGIKLDSVVMRFIACEMRKFGLEARNFESGIVIHISEQNFAAYKTNFLFPFGLLLILAYNCGEKFRQ